MIQNHGLLFGFRLSCIYAGIAAFVSAFILLFFLKETSLNEAPFRKKLTVAKLKDFPASVPAKLRALMLSHIFIAFANGAVGSYYILYASKIIGLKPLEWALIAGLQSLMTTLKIPGGWLGDRFGKRRIMIFSILTCAPCTILFTFSGSLLQTSIVMLLLAATGISYAPAYEALQADLTPRKIRGRITALWQLGSSLAIAAGAFMGGFLFQTFNPSLPFYIFTVGELFAALLLIGFVREPREKEI